MLDAHRNPDGTYDGVGVMADLTGLSRQSVVDIAAQVRANSERLAACPYHEFSPIVPSTDTPRAAMRPRYRCIECGGEVDANAYHWHQQGRRPDPAA